MMIILIDKREQNTSVRVFSLEEEHKRLMKQLDVDNFSLSRIPRPEEVAKEKNSKTIKKIPKPKEIWLFILSIRFRIIDLDIVIW